MNSVTCPDPIRSGLLLPPETIRLLEQAEDGDLFVVKRDGARVCLTKYSPEHDYLERLKRRRDLFIDAN